MEAKNRAKKTVKAVGTGLFLAAATLNNSPIRTRLGEIEEEMERLQEEKDRLEARLLRRY